ncbi:MAG: pyruvoyl-dependent arginine decarboxylase, partial [Candidatus Ranarchaeia archaeon]
ISSHFPDRIAAAIVVQPTEGGPHLVAEFSGKTIDTVKAEEKARDIIGMMAQNRGLKITKKPICKSIEHQVKEDHYSAVFVGVVYQKMSQK